MNTTLQDLSETKRALLAKRLQQAQAKKTETVSIARRPPGDTLPLSFAQQRLWFLSQWEPASPTYNIPVGLRLTGTLNVTALRQALNEIVRRHEVLRTIYVATDGDPLQYPHPDPILSLEVIALDQAPPAQRDAEVRSLAEQEAQTIFQLERDLPIRARLLQVTETEHWLLLTLHHIAADGWSMGVLLKELATLYAAYSAGQPSPLPELPIQYADFAYWQRAWLSGGVMEKQLDYWRRQLTGTPPALELPTDRPRPPVHTYRGGLCHFSLPPALTQAVRSLSQQTGVTPFMTLLAAFQILLQRYTRQGDIVVGTPIAGRNRSESEGLIGCFINTLVLRSDLTHNPRAAELLQQVRHATLEAYAHQDLPFEKLVEELQPERSLSYSPFFQVMFIFNNMSQSALQLPGLEVEFLVTDSGTAKFDLSLALEDGPEALSGTLTYNTDLFNLETIQRLPDHFQILLEGITANPQQRVADLPLLPRSELQQLLVEWNQTSAPLPAAPSIPQLFEAQVARTPQALAVTCEDHSYTYRELNERANRLAYWLRQRGIGPEVRVGLFMDRSLDLMVGLWGILKAGGAYVPLDPLYPPDRLRAILQSAQVPVLLTQAHLAHSLPEPGAVEVLCLDRDWPALAACPTDNLAINVVPDNLMYVLFTSGSTGQPKGVAVQQRSYLNYLQAVLKRLALPSGLSYAIVSTFAADLGTPMVYGALCTGGQLHVIPYERAVDPEAVADYFRRHRIDVMKLVPSHFDNLLMQPDPASVIPQQRLILAGEASQWGTLDKVRSLRPELVIQNHYGPTETTVSVLAYAVETWSADRAGAVPLGRPLDNIQVYVLDAYQHPVPQGVPGELCLGGAGVARGYLGRPDLTAERFIPDPFGQQPGSRLYRTGDLVRYLPDGNLEFLGRLDFQVKIRGYRVELGEIETLLSNHPVLQDAAVIAREDTPGDKRLVAYLVPQAAQQDVNLISQLRDFLRERLPDYMVPTAFVTLDALPLNPNGKLDRRALPPPDQTQRVVADAFSAPRNALEEHLAAVWTEVLGLAQVGIDDNFFEIGGESFKAIRVVRKIDTSVSVMDLFKYPTIRQLAEHLTQGQSRQTGLLHELTKPLSAHPRKVSVVCTPYGGASAITFQPLANALPKDCSLYAVELPGHDYSRSAEVLQPLEEVAQRCVAEIKQLVVGPVAIYGHCLGGALAVEIARLLEASGTSVLGVFLGGTFPSPRLPGRLFEWLARLFPSDRWISNRSYQEFLKALGGFTDVIDPAEQAFLMQSLRHDAREAEDYYSEAYATSSTQKLAAPLVCIVGQKDRVTEFYEERYREWAFFSDSVELAVIPRAGHYFLKHQADELAHLLVNQIATWQGIVAPATPPVTTKSLANNAHEQAPAGPRPAEASRIQSRRTLTPSLRTFLIVALGQFVSLIGSGLTGFALGVWVYQQTGSVSAFALISVCSMLPGILVSPIAGAVADRYDRRLIMIVSDTTAASATLATVLLLATHSLQIWHIYLITSVSSIANAFQRPAYAAAIAQLVPKQHLGRANGLTQLGGATGDMLASLLGGLLVLTIGLHGVILIDFITFLFAVTVMLLIRFPDTLFKKQEEPLGKEILRGWQYVIKRRSLVVMVAFFVVVNYLLSIPLVLTTPLLLSFGTPAILGAVLAAGPAGTLVGGLLMSLWGGTKRRAEGMVGFVALMGFATAVMGFSPAPLFSALGLFGIWAALALINAHWLAIIQTKVGLELQGRVIALNQMLAWSMMPLGYLTAGALADRIFEPWLRNGGPLADSLGHIIGTGQGRGMGLLMIVVGVTAILWAVWGYRLRSLRFMEDLLPDAISDGIIPDDKDQLQELADHHLAPIGESLRRAPSVNDLSEESSL
ncbi:nonribosomal peptide synthetase DhbF [Thermoflexales bacterium]|nr:nonribosomal peptide synthetase DhbF [Thermoflexales bacterium]